MTARRRGSPSITRRDLLGGTLAGLVGCAAEDSAVHTESGCADRFAGGTLLGVVPFEDAAGVPLDVPVGDGLDGRLYTDLSKLPIGAPVVDSDRFYIRTRYPDRLDPAAPWKLRVFGDEIAIAEIARRAHPMGTVLLECSGNAARGAFGLLSTARWSGIRLTDLLAEHAKLEATTRVLVSGFDGHSRASERSVPGASWIFTVEQLSRAGAFVATEMNGAPVPRDHGAPVRLVVPGWYGCTCIKWVDTIAIVPDDAPSTPHMREFASRTMQAGEPVLARDFAPASIDQAAMPVRVERWRTAEGTLYRVVGILWGGERPTNALSIFLGAEPPEHVDVCPPPTTNATWTFWTYAWRPSRTGPHSLRLMIEDPSVRARRLAAGYYTRSVIIDG